MKNKPLPLTSIKDIAREFGLVDMNSHLKYTDLELIQLVALHIRSLEGKLEKARKIYKEMRTELEELKSPKLWSFGLTREAPPDFKAEYMKRIKQKTVGHTGAVRAVRDVASVSEEPLTEL